jgi:hypothetical protein
MEMTPEIVSHNSPFHFLWIISTLLGAAGSTTRHRKRFRVQTPKTKSQFKCGMCVRAKEPVEMTPEIVSHNSPFHFLSIISTLLGAAGCTTRQ